MLTVPVEAGSAAANRPARILVIGRTETVSSEAALSGGTTGPAATVTYDAQSRSIGISLDVPQDVTVIAWWHTSFVPPEPKSTSRVILDEELPAGAHTIAVPGEVPAQASFATVSAGASVHAFIVGPMPSGTTLARFPSAS